MSMRLPGQVVALRLPSVRLAAIDPAKTPKQNSPKRESPSQWTRNVSFDFPIHVRDCSIADMKRCSTRHGMPPMSACSVFRITSVPKLRGAVHGL